MLAYFLACLLVIIGMWILGIAVGWAVPYMAIIQGIDWLKVNPWQSSLVAGLLLLLALLIFLRPRQQVPVTSFRTLTKLGEVRITQEALKEIISRTAMTVSGVRQVQADVRQSEGGLELTLAAQFNPEVVIPAVSEELQGRLKEDIEHHTGIPVAEVKVLVKSSEGRQARVK